MKGEDHDEPEQEGEPGGQDPEHPGGAVAVGEVAAVRGAPADQQHGGDRHRHRRRDEDDSQGKVHDDQVAASRSGAHHLDRVITEAFARPEMG